jgi:hypothetical protein
VPDGQGRHLIPSRPGRQPAARCTSDLAGLGLCTGRKRPAVPRCAQHRSTMACPWPAPAALSRLGRAAAAGARPAHSWQLECVGC